MSRVLPAGDWIRIESPRSTSRTEGGRVPAVVPQRVQVAAGVEVTEIEGEVSVVVTCVVGTDAAATGVVTFVVIEEVQPAIRRPQSLEPDEKQGCSLVDMICRRIFSRLLCVCYVYYLLCLTNGIFSHY